MPQEYTRATGRSQIDDAADVLDVPAAAIATGMSSRFIANAIRRERKEPGTGLKAFVPGGAKPGGGRGIGYRINKADLQAWWLGEEKPTNGT